VKKSWPQFHRLSVFLAIAALLSGTSFSAPAFAQFQDAIVRIVVPMAAGGPTDFIARQIAERLREPLGAKVVVENKPGANGATGATAVATSPADGKSLLLATSGLLTITPHLDPKLPINPVTDLTPISLVVVNDTALVVRANYPASNIAEFVALAKKSDKPLSLGSAGYGNILHLYVELLKDATKADFLHVPYRGIAPALTDVIAGNVDGAFADLPASLPQIQGGTMKALGLVGETRSKAAPDIPTIAEQGYPGVVGASWFGLFGPAKMDPKLADDIAAKLRQVLTDPTLVAAFNAVGAKPIPTTRTEFADRIERDREYWGRLIKAHNVQADK
jgi:tripartite-type tricarboxylate transporter receptor subunit TctC